MRRRKNPPEVVSMSFLDLICCAFGGILLLYILADRTNGEENPATKSLRLVIAELPRAYPEKLGMRITVKGKAHYCWPGVKRGCVNGKVLWSAINGRTTATILGADIEGYIDVFMLRTSDRFAFPERVCVRVSSPGSSLDVALPLERSEGYRASISLDDSHLGC